MTDNNFKKFVDMCRAYIGEKSSVEAAEIDDAILKLTGIFPDVNTEDVKKDLMTMYSQPVNPYKILLNTNNPGAGWLTKNDNLRKTSINWNFWERYERFLRENDHYQPGVIHQLNRITDEILDNLFDPEQKDIKFNKKGLVVGQVQSGKTSNFTGLICKAVDSGFDLIIVFAGLLDDLRTQTQTRLEKYYLGFSTKDFKIIEKEPIGVGLITNKPVSHAFTTIMSDFKETTANSIGINFNTKEPIIFVVKKNGYILENLKKWLPKKICKEKTVLFIDDEADNASVNTKKEKDKASTINKKIRELIKIFPRNAYVGYTATPYANILIDRNNESDLFPRHFIINLPTPAAYISPERVFGWGNNEESPLPIVNIVRDYSTFVPDKHKKDEIVSLTYDNIPESLKYAIRCFILACAVRIYRGQGKKHNSMLIHLSRFQIWQKQIKDLVLRLFSYYKNEIIADDKAIFEQFKKDFEENYIEKNGYVSQQYLSFVNTTDYFLEKNNDVITDNITKVSWADLKPLLYSVVEKIEVKALNGLSTDTLAYDDHKEDGYYVIAVGGDKLSRGLTLEGLTISYFLRASKMYDTLMQMGRWFGYRPGYVDVCRLFISEEIDKWFKAITLANHELREEFDYLWQTKSSPEQYALKVRTSPGLYVTSPLKMFSARNVQISWASTLVETYSLKRTPESKNNNYNVTNDFIKSLGSYKKQHQKGYLWLDVSYQIICDYISKFEIAETVQPKMDFGTMVKYINKCATDYDELKRWRVVVRTIQDKSLNEEDHSVYSFGFNNEINGICSNRSRINSFDQKDNIYNLHNCRIIPGQKDEFLDYEILDELDKLAPALELTKENNNKWSKDYPSPLIVRKEYRQSCHPLLIIYPLNPNKAKNSMESDNDLFRLNSLPFIGFAIVFPNSKNPEGVNYKAAAIKEYSDSELIFEQDNDNEEISYE